MNLKEKCTFILYIYIFFKKHKNNILNKRPIRQLLITLNKVRAKKQIMLFSRRSKVSFFF